MQQNTNNRRVAIPNKEQVQFAVVDGMAEIQSLEKPEWLKNCAQLAEHFSNRGLQTYIEVLKCV